MANFSSSADLSRASSSDAAVPQAAGRRIDCVLVEQGLVNEEDALKALADALGLKFVDLSDGRDRPGACWRKFPTSAVFRHTILPIGRDNGKVRVATHDPFNLEALNELSALSGFRLDPVLARRDDVLQRIKEHLGVGGDTINELVARNVEEGVEIVGDDGRRRRRTDRRSPSRPRSSGW